jgi:hypothetical protein
MVVATVSLVLLANAMCDALMDLSMLLQSNTAEPGAMVTRAAKRRDAI